MLDAFTVRRRQAAKMVTTVAFVVGLGIVSLGQAAQPINTPPPADGIPPAVQEHANAKAKELVGSSAFAGSPKATCVSLSDTLFACTTSVDDKANASGQVLSLLCLAQPATTTGDTSTSGGTATCVPGQASGALPIPAASTN